MSLDLKVLSEKLENRDPVELPVLLVLLVKLVFPETSDSQEERVTMVSLDHQVQSDPPVIVASGETEERLVLKVLPVPRVNAVLLEPLVDKVPVVLRVNRELKEKWVRLVDKDPLENLDQPAIREVPDLVVNPVLQVVMV